MRNLNLYTKTTYNRKLKLEGSICGPNNFPILHKELVRRGILKEISFKFNESGTSFVSYEGEMDIISQDTDKNIKELAYRKYKVIDLSLLSLIESVLIETSESQIFVDLLKIEILLKLINREKIFRNNGVLLYNYYEMKSIYKKWNFFPVLQTYLFDLGKMLVFELRHDLIINKKLKGKLALHPSSRYDKIYEYFSKIDYYYFNNSVYKNFQFKI